MTKGRRVLVTGAAGYIGSTLVRMLLANGHEVRGLDSLLFGGQSLVELVSQPNFTFIKGDLRDRDTVAKAVEGVDAIVHLAAIVGDPACKKFADEATEVMQTASEELFAAAQAAGVQHFVFASTCSNYGLMDGDNLLTEESPLQPQSHYAKLKVGFEQFLLDRAQAAMATTILRFATVYGHSPRPRFDLTINHFCRDLSLGLPLKIFGAKLWRPYCHVQDLARSVALVLDAGAPAMRGKVYNVGDSDENYTKTTIAEAILQVAPQGEVSYVEAPNQDLRDYRVDFSRIADELGFRISKKVPDGIAEIHALVTSGLLADPFDPIYQNC